MIKTAALLVLIAVGTWGWKGSLRWKTSRKMFAPLVTSAVVIASLSPGSMQSGYVSSAQAAELKASDLIQSDLKEDKVVLESILQILKLNRGLVDSKDYKSIRTSMRSGSVNALRKTCKQVCKVLGSETEQTAFNQAYESMIDKLNDFDTTVTKRIQGTGVPKEKEAQDEELGQLLDSLVASFESMLKVIS